MLADGPSPIPSTGDEHLIGHAWETALGGPEKLLREMLESVQDFAILSTDLSGRVTVWNTGAEKIFGYRSVEMFGQSADILFTPEDRGNGVPDLERKSASESGRAEDERWHMRKDGSRFFASGVMTPLRNGAGELYGYCKMARDVTAHHEAEVRDAFFSRLSEALRPLREPAAVLWQLVYLLGKQTRANRCCFGEIDPTEQYVTVHRDYIQGVVSTAGVHLLDAFGPEIIRQLRRGELLRIVDTDTDPRTMGPEAKASFAATQTRAVLSVPLVKEGRFLALLVLNSREPREWTFSEEMLLRQAAERAWLALEATRAELAVRRSEERLRLALEGARLGTWDFAPKTDELRWDERCKELFGLSVDADVDYRTFLAGLHPDDRDRVDKAARGALNPAGDGRYDCEFRTVGLQDGGIVRWVRASGRAFFDSKGEAERFIGTAVDITQRRLAEAQLRESEERYRLIGEAVGSPGTELEFAL